MQKILKEHFARYPLMQPQDAVKLCYQSEFGGGHMIPNRQRALERLDQEMAQTVQTGGSLLEDIGGYYRLYLRAVQQSGLRAETVNGLFCHTADHACSSMQGFSQRLRALEELAAAGEAPFGAAELVEYLRDYRAQGCPAVSHTPLYREHYAPAYRLVPRQSARLLPLLQAIDAVLARKGTACVAIDGMCGAGKSTFAALLADVYSAQLFHMDDYFLPFARKTPQRLVEPGGNVDYERFYDEIGSRTVGEMVVWRAFDCACGALGEPTVTEAAPVRIVEGSYSQHPYFGEIYDVRAWVQVDEALQQERILRRNGPEMLKRFIEEWIPMEKRYVQAFAAPLRSIVLSGAEE